MPRILLFSCFVPSKCCILRSQLFYPPAACLPVRDAGGANVPALNDLLAPFGVALGDAILQGTPTIAGTGFAACISSITLSLFCLQDQ